MLFVRKLFEQADVLVIVCVQIAVAACTSDALQGVNHNEFRCRMLCQELLNLLFQPVLERVSHDRKMQRQRRIFRQVKKPCLDTPERIFETEIQRFALFCEVQQRLIFSANFIFWTARKRWSAKMVMQSMSQK